MSLRVRACLLLSTACLVPLHAQDRVVEAPLPESGVRIGPRPAPAGASSTVLCVDRGEAAWVLVYGLPARDATAPCAQPAMQRVAARDAAALARRLKTWQVHDIAPEAQAALRVVTLAVQQPAVPVGLTWDGGMAITATDYSDAERRLAAYRADPKGYAARYWK